VSDPLVFAIVVAAILGGGIALGMLVAPRLTRLAERDEEEPGDDERG
jgi:hypothetical protein